MNKLTIKISVLVFFVASTAFGQTKFRFGLHGTPLFSYISTTDPAANPDLKLKFGYGLLAEYAFAEKYSIATGLDIMNRGAEVQYQDTSLNYKAGFIHLPLAIRMRTKEFGYFTYYAEFGGALAFKISEEIEFDPNLPEIMRIDNYVNPINAMFSIGAGAEYSLGGSTSLIAGIIYNRSLGDNLNEDDSRVSDSYTYRFDYVSLRIGIFF